MRELPRSSVLIMIEALWPSRSETSELPTEGPNDGSPYVGSGARAGAPGTDAMFDLPGIHVMDVGQAKAMIARGMAVECAPPEGG